MIAPGCDPPVIATVATAYVDGVLIGCIVPTIIGATSAVGSPVHPIIGSSITAIASYSAACEGIP